MRRNEKVYKELDLKSPKLSNASLIKAMAENPILIERPIFIYNGKAVIGRPPEKLISLL